MRTIRPAIVVVLSFTAACLAAGCSKTTPDNTAAASTGAQPANAAVVPVGTKSAKLDSTGTDTTPMSKAAKDSTGTDTTPMRLKRDSLKKKKKG